MGKQRLLIMAAEAQDMTIGRTLHSIRHKAPASPGVNGMLVGEQRRFPSPLPFPAHLDPRSPKNSSASGAEKRQRRVTNCVNQSNLNDATLIKNVNTNEECAHLEELQEDSVRQALDRADSTDINANIDMHPEHLRIPSR